MPNQRGVPPILEVPMSMLKDTGSHDHTVNRRRFLKFLAGSPLLACLGTDAASAAQKTKIADILEALTTASDLIDTPEAALNVFDFEPVARHNLSMSHYGYLATGVDDNATLRANREGFARYELCPRRLVDVQQVDMSVELFGETWETPIILSPVASLQAFHDEGEIAVARAADKSKHLKILSTASTTSVEDVIEARGAPVWFQLYPTSVWDITKNLVKRAEAAGCPVLVLTVDILAGSNRETLERFKRINNQEICAACHEPGLKGYLRSKPMFDGLDITGAQISTTPGLTWDFIRRLKDITDMKLVIKGIVTREDAALCVEHGVDGLIVSNHGGRAAETGRATIACLPEVVEVVGGRIPVLIDSGFRRGTDIFKALALGADAICIGRPYLWGLAAFGQTGVEKVLNLLRAELRLVMRQMGTVSIKRISEDYVVHEG